MLPLSDDNRGRRTQPYVTWALIAVNVIIYAYESTLVDASYWRFLQDWAVFPNQISDGQQLHTLLTSAFLHGSWFHLGSNMLFLWIFGDNVEDVFGHVRYILFYIVTALAAGAAQVLIDPTSTIPLVGASGAISGVLAAYIVLFPHGLIRTAVTLGFFITVTMLPAWLMIGYWFFIQVISGVAALDAAGDSTGGVAFFAHIGGFVAGLILARLLANSDRLRHQRRSRTDDWESRTWGRR